MIDVLPDHSDRFVQAIGPDPDAVLEEMHEYAVEQGFPHVGPGVGSWLQLLARMADAKRVFEFGSGFGYSAYWFARALPEDGEVVLTEVDEDELEQAREYLQQGYLADRATFEAGDAMDVIESYDGPFDVVLIDHQKERYADALDAVREKVAPGGFVVADNAMTSDSSVEFESLLRARTQDRSLEHAESGTRGVDEYLRQVGADQEFVTGVLPLGDGIAVSQRRA